MAGHAALHVTGNPFDHVTQDIKDFSERIRALGRKGGHQRQIGRDESLLFVTDIVGEDLREDKVDTF